MSKNVNVNSYLKTALVSQGEELLLDNKLLLHLSSASRADVDKYMLLSVINLCEKKKGLSKTRHDIGWPLSWGSKFNPPFFFSVIILKSIWAGRKTHVLVQHLCCCKFEPSKTLSFAGQQLPLMTEMSEQTVHHNSPRQSAAAWHTVHSGLRNSM